MKKVKRRTYSILVLVLTTCLFMTVFIFRLVADGEAWATFPTNQNIYRDGHLAVGAVFDRNGVPLVAAGERGLEFNQNTAIRRATFHVVGDRRGRIGTSTLVAHAGDLVGYNFFTGTYSLGGGGNTIQLTVDAELNRVAYNALNGRRGAVVVMNYETGEVIVNVSNPSYDPVNPPTFDLDDPVWNGVYLNRVISGIYTPGSTFKVVTAAAAIDTFADAMTREYICNGYTIVAGNRVTCLGTHGRISMERAMGVSCNVFFAELALDLGGPLLRQYTERAGLLSAHNVDKVRTAPGNFTAAEAGSAALAWSGVGQSENLINPLGMARFMGAVARGGTPVEPRLIESISSGILPESVSNILPGGRAATGNAALPPGTAARLSTLLRDTAINYYGGTFPGLAVAGKTGTAEVDDGRPHAWFVGFLDDPHNPLAFVVIVENGGGGLSVAAPVANTVLQAAVR
ncbi:MAG: penicillin-binding transpeptidase domain-containing protein [Oscillospiraceae bacterium]|nr:penicillin-binding transpeptidase domain-containing protein [Oscillospiraceae bacterium]